MAGIDPERRSPRAVTGKTPAQRRASQRQNKLDAAAAQDRLREYREYIAKSNTFTLTHWPAQ